MGMARRPGALAALGALLLITVATTAAGRVLLEDSVPSRTVEERLLIETADLVLSLDASEANAGSELTALAPGTTGDATVASADAPGMSVRLFGVGYDTAFGGSALFTAPAEGSGAAGTYGLSTELLSVTEGAWGDEFTAVAWFKASGAADPESVLMQVLYTTDDGDWGSSATWRLGSFSDKAPGYVSLDGFQAEVPYTVGADCWQQLAVVKSGSSLTFYYNKDVAGTTDAGGFVVTGYGATAIALGVDYATAGGSNATGVDTSQPGLGWLSGGLGMAAVYSSALDAAAIGAMYDEQQGRFAEALCSTGPAPSPPSLPGAPPPSPAVVPESPPPPSPPLLPGQPPVVEPPVVVSPSPPPPPPLDAASPPPSPVVPGVTPPPSPPVTPGDSPPPPSPVVIPGVTPSPSPPVPTPGVNPSPPSGPGPSNPPSPPSTLDISTATVGGSGTSGQVSNRLSFTGGPDLSDFDTNLEKQEELKRAIVLSLNLDPSYTSDNVQLRVIKCEERPATSVTRVTIIEWVVVCEYILLPTPVCPVEVLEKEEINVYLFIRVQQPVIKWWTGPTATVCQCKEDGECHRETPPVPPPVVIPDCSSNICFLLDGSKSLINVDGWNDVVAAANSIMHSISSPDSIFDVFWFSNEVERIGTTVTGAEVAQDNSFTRELVNTTPRAHGTFMSQAIGTCQGVLGSVESSNSKTIVLITDGKPTDREEALAASDAAKAQGIKMVVVGAGEIDYETLKQLSSGPSFTFANYNLDSSQLALMADLASEGVCRELD